MKNTYNKNSSFSIAAHPMIAWLREYGHPHMKVIITMDGAELVEGVSNFISKSSGLQDEKGKFIYPVWLDIESNGFGGSSVLSIAAIKPSGETFHRFYYPAEDYNENAIAFNGLNKERIDSERKHRNATYSDHFFDDDDFLVFMSDVDTFISHNVKFDYSFLPGLIQKNLKNIFCTMKGNKQYFNGRWPNLKKACEYYGIVVDEEQQHGALYDAQLCKALFESMKSKDIIYTDTYLIDEKKPK